VEVLSIWLLLAVEAAQEREQIKGTTGLALAAAPVAF
jgi:hypothetical protein